MSQVKSCSKTHNSLDPLGIRYSRREKSHTHTLRVFIFNLSHTLILCILAAPWSSIPHLVTQHHLWLSTFRVALELQEGYPSDPATLHVPVNQHFRIALEYNGSDSELILTLKKRVSSLASMRGIRAKGGELPSHQKRGPFEYTGPVSFKYYLWKFWNTIK